MKTRTEKKKTVQTLILINQYECFFIFKRLLNWFDSTLSIINYLNKKKKFHRWGWMNDIFHWKVTEINSSAAKFILI